jgi:PST family polysaccharide transporter
MIWSLIRDGGRYITSYASYFVLAFYLSPKDFGVVAIAVLSYQFLYGFLDMGFSAALIQKRELDESQINSVFFLNIGLGFLLLSMTVALASPLSLFFSAPELTPILIVISFSFVIQSLSLTHLALAQRALMFRALAFRDILSSFLSGILGIIMAVRGFGAWSLVCQFLSNAILNAILIWFISSWRPSIRFSWTAITSLWPYSSRIVIYNAFKGIVQHLDRFLIGYFLQPTTLGLFQFANKIAIYPTTTFCGAVGNYLFPKFSSLQNQPDVIREYYLRYLKLINVWVMPFAIIIITGAPLIRVIFGEQWASSIELVQVLAVVAVIQSFFSPIGQLMKALNKPDWLLMWSIGFAAILALSVGIGAQFSIRGVTVGILIGHLVSLPVMMQIMIRLTECQITDIFKAVSSSLVASAVMVLWLVFWVWLDVGLAFFAFVAGGGVLYLAVLWALDHTFIKETLKRSL